MPASRLLYLNGSFDLSYLSTPLDAYASQLRQQTLWFLPAGTSYDRIILDLDPNGEYLAYLRSLGLDPPAIASGSNCDGLEAWPWGWNSDAVARFNRFHASMSHPGLECVKQANSRETSVTIAALLQDRPPRSIVCYSAAETRARIDEHPVRPLVVKPCFGNTGIGFRVIGGRTLTDKESLHVSALFNAGNPLVVVEPWLRRVADLSSRFELGRDGSAAGLVHYRTLVTSGGAAYGMVIDPADTLVLRHAEELDDACRFTARSLHERGYFGPVNIDSMVVQDADGAQRLVPVVEINARQSVGAIALAVRQRLAPDRCFLLRTLGRPRNRLPLDYTGYLARLGSLHFDPESKTGAGCLTPLSVEDSKNYIRPHRAILFCAAKQRDELERMDRRLTEVVRGSGYINW